MKIIRTEKKLDKNQNLIRILWIFNIPILKRIRHIQERVITGGGVSKSMYGMSIESAV